MTLKRMDHVGIVVDDMAKAIAFFTALGLELRGEGEVEGDWVGRVIGLDGVHSQLVFLQTPDGNSRVELAQFRAPSFDGDRVPGPANQPGLRHLAFAVEDLEASLEALRAHGAELVGSVENYADHYLLCYVRGPGGMLVELAQELGG